MSQAAIGNGKSMQFRSIRTNMTIAISFNNMAQVLLILLLVAFLNSYNIEAQPTYLYHICNNNNYTSNSTYAKNLNTTLSSLSATNTTNAIATGFANATTGQATSESVYGLYLCRGDMLPAVCGDCVKAASQEIIQKCPGKKVSVIWYDECMLRYSNSDIFGSVNTNDGVTMWNTMNVTNPDQFRQQVEKTMSEVIPNAANSETGKKFAVARANFTFRTLYTLAQCTPDLTAADCNSCLGQIAAQLQLDKQGSRFLTPSCNVRVELYPFYNESAVPAPPPPPPSVPVQPPSRAPPPRTPVTNKGKKISTAVIVAIVAPVAAVFVLILIGCCFIRRKALTEENIIKPDESVMEDMSGAESLQFDLTTIQAATSNFSPENKLGEGGFGSVYKGTLPNGKNIAVKRLSRSPGQGDDEFRNEVEVVAKLQHRNLVQLFGFCLQGEEKLLVFEFVSNKSLDYFLFDPEKQVLLDWNRRYKIMTGIAKGMLYLHEDSRLRIIHRDLKPSNVLLDSEFNPKVSDFGMARIFGVDQTQGNTSRVVGTYGYMSPEYAMHGQISVKTDVYSFGILLLEIISGKKSNFLHQSGHTEILPSFAWKHWRNGTPLEIVDPLLRDSFNSNEAIRCIHVALLCVQEDPADRPTMATIVLMLNSQSVSMAVPQQPAFFFHSKTGDVDIPYSKASSSDQSTPKSTPVSVNDVSITELYPR